MGCDQKSFKLVWWCHQLLSRFLTKGHLPRVSPQLLLCPKENRGKPQLGNCLMKAVRPLIASNVVPYLRMRSLRSHSTTGKEKDVKKEKKGWDSMKWNGIKNDMHSVCKLVTVFSYMGHQCDEVGEEGGGAMFHKPPVWQEAVACVEVCPGQCLTTSTHYVHLVIHLRACASPNC